jgi:preprotein translocase subunit SecD
MLVIKQGTVVLEAAPRTASTQPAFCLPTAQYYVLNDRVALFGNAITNPKRGTDTGGEPDVSFAFTPTGARIFQRVTATLARRGFAASARSSTLDQHFAVALDSQLITVPSIDFRMYPEGIALHQSADITGAFTITTAKDVATELRFGALPVQLIRVTRSPARSG